MGYAAELAGLYQESVDAVDYARMGERIDAEIAALRARVKALEAALREVCDDYEEVVDGESLSTFVPIPRLLVHKRRYLLLSVALEGR